MSLDAVLKIVVLQKLTINKGATMNIEKNMRGKTTGGFLRTIGRFVLLVAEVTHAAAQTITTPQAPDHRQRDTDANWEQRKESALNQICAIEANPPRNAPTYSIARRVEELRGDVRAAYRDRSEVLMRCVENDIATFAKNGY
jgi:hypothetical protein